MDKNKLKKYQIFSIIFTFILGTLLHFTFELSGENKFVAVFSAVNESVWEHLKLLFFPMLLTTIIGYFYLKKDKNSLLCSKTVGIIISMIFTVVFFYTYTGIIGRNVAFIDISLFFIATLIGESITYILLINDFKCKSKIAIIILIVILLCFIVFTFFTPKIGLFKDLISEKYGIIKINEKN